VDEITAAGAHLIVEQSQLADSIVPGKGLA
jgi:hypothetical protein